MISRRKLRAVTCIAEGNSMTRTARIVGVSRMTLWRWLREEEVKTLLLETGVQVRNDFRALWNTLYRQAFESLQEAFNDADARVRLYAVKLFLDRNDKQVELENQRRLLEAVGEKKRLSALPVSDFVEESKKLLEYIREDERLKKLRESFGQSDRSLQNVTSEE